jgi:hypothetical protein
MLMMVMVKKNLTENKNKILGGLMNPFPARRTPRAE